MELKIELAAAKNAGDNHPSHYDVVSVQTLQECQEKCVEAAICVGIEYSLGRCEVWHRTEGIEASIELEGFLCQSFLAFFPEVVERMLGIAYFAAFLPPLSFLLTKPDKTFGLNSI